MQFLARVLSWPKARPTSGAAGDPGGPAHASAQNDPNRVPSKITTPSATSAPTAATITMSR